VIVSAYNAAPTLLSRPDFAGAGMKIIDMSLKDLGIKFAPINSGGSSDDLVLFLPKAAQESGSGKKFPLVILFPTAPLPIVDVEKHGWGQLAIDRDVILLVATCYDGLGMSDLLDYLQARYPIDPSRIYGTGFSGGGHMCIDTVSGAPERFAAVTPIDVFYGPQFFKVYAEAPSYPYDLDLPIAVIGHGRSSESTNYDGHYVWFDALQQIKAINEVPLYTGGLDYSKYPYWGFPVQNERKIETPQDIALWIGYDYDAKGVPMTSFIHTDIVAHSWFPETAELIWSYFSMFSRDTTTHATVYSGK
jgi:hypothetical protein